jgi:hypothetical protein
MTSNRSQTKGAALKPQQWLRKGFFPTPNAGDKSSLVVRPSNIHRTHDMRELLPRSLGISVF